MGIKTILFSWVGKADLTGATSNGGPGPLMSIIEHKSFDELHIAHNYSEDEVEDFKQALLSKYKGKVCFNPVTLTSPIEFAEIYTAADSILKKIKASYPKSDLFLQITSGTPAMSAVSILLGKAKYSTKFIQSSIEQGVQEVDLPFDIAADFIPALVNKQDAELTALLSKNAPDTAEFDNIITQNPDMERLKQRAAIIAARDVPILIHGETGTGKELFAKAIHNSSRRKDRPLLTLNCGAIPKDLIDTTLFGHVKGAFTGATEKATGYFEDADGGTLFLDELGELPLESQVRLLRVLQEGTFSPVGTTANKSVNVRIIAATHRNLINEVAEGNFREDLFYRLAVGVLDLPPLRERAGDIPIIADYLLKQHNKNSISDFENDKKLSASAINFISSYPWPGNVRELDATLLRASIWCPSKTMQRTDIESALITQSSKREDFKSLDVAKGIDISDVVADVCMFYINKALNVTGGNKKRASELLGLKNYQTLNNWIEKYGAN
tara:strand:- start:1833 stop:3326 length:1494 start_codon:yes stop_codon:yes gene_type:complete